MDLQIDDGLRIPARDGFRLAATLYEPTPGTGRDAVVLVSSATGAPVAITIPTPATWPARASR